MLCVHTCRSHEHELLVVDTLLACRAIRPLVGATFARYEVAARLEQALAVLLPTTRASVLLALLPQLHVLRLEGGDLVEAATTCSGAAAAAAAVAAASGGHSILQFPFEVLQQLLRVLDALSANTHLVHFPLRQPEHAPAPIEHPAQSVDESRVGAVDGTTARPAPRLGQVSLAERLPGSEVVVLAPLDVEPAVALHDAEGFPRLGHGWCLHRIEVLRAPTLLFALLLAPGVRAEGGRVLNVRRDRNTGVEAGDHGQLLVCRDGDVADVELDEELVLDV
mmetsp:Transcript_58674/g.164631  ORF Transcript_58674/g.164631 Transcript_58674/m.164631 type:complete len:279 (+) Transcript_58674:214-1050(+)